MCSTVALVMWACGASAQAQTTLFLEDFGTGNDRSATPNANVPAGFGFLSTGPVVDNNYAIIGNGSLPIPGPNWTLKIPDYPDDNRVMVVNAGTTQASMYRRGFTARVGHTYTLSAKRYIVNGNLAAGNGPLAWSMEISPQGGGAPLFNSGSMNSDPALHRNLPSGNNPEAAWQTSQYRFSFVVNPNCATPMPGKSIELQTDLINRTSENSGNDFYVDDIQLVEGPVVSDADIPSICVLPPPLPAAVPTLEFAGLGLLGVLSAGMGALALRRRRRAE